ncbi:MAG: DNA polymerase/3'-5' exonuclease PolX [Nitrososphaeraceae archaeon]
MNLEIANILREIAYILEMGVTGKDGEDPKSKIGLIFKIRSYRRAADVIENLYPEIDELYKTEKISGLLKIPSIGKAIALKLEEYITTGKLRYYEDLRKDIPINVSELMNLEGIGPKTIMTLYTNLKIKNISELEKAALGGKIRNIAGFSKKREEAILNKIQFFRKGKERRLIGEIYPLVKEIEDRLASVPGIRHAIAAGSFRRMRETIGDVDFLVSILAKTENTTKAKIIDYFTSMPEVREIVGKGASKAFVKLRNGVDADLLVVPEDSFGAALQYFTGSKEHGVGVRKVALSKGFKLNEWGVFDARENRIAGRTEEEVYKILGMEWIPPEIRENRGEIELALGKEGHQHKKKSSKGRAKLPQLIDYNDLRGDLQVHSNYSDGKFSIEEMAQIARIKFGLKYIAISDHTTSLKLANGLDGQELIDQSNKIAEINEVNKGIGFHILSGAEVNIQKDGSLDIPNNVLDKLEVVGAAIHSNFSLPIDVQTNRLLEAAKNPSVDIIYHPTGRIINRRDGYPVNMIKLIETARDTKTVLEIDAHYNRLDLKDEYIRMAVENDVNLVIDSDAHHPLHFAFLRFGIGQARRGWAEKSSILNTLPFEQLLDSLK